MDMGFMIPDILCSNLVKIVPNVSIYHFGILESNMHMAWMRTVCGRMKSDYRYSNDIVYVTVQSTPNNAPTALPRKAATMASKEETP